MVKQIKNTIIFRFLKSLYQVKARSGKKSFRILTNVSDYSVDTGANEQDAGWSGQERGEAEGAPGPQAEEAI